MEEALSLQREIGDKRQIASAQHSIAGVLAYQGEYAQALGHYKQALGIESEIGDRWGRAFTLMEIGSLYQDLSDIEGALDLHKTALGLMDELGLETERIELLARMGIDLLLQGESKAALEKLSEALALTDQLGARGALPSVLEGLARVWLSLGNRYEAMHFCDRLLDISRERGLRRHNAAAKMLKGQIPLMGVAHPDLEGLKESENDLKDARKIARQIGGLPLLWQIHSALGGTYQACGEARKASREYGKARKIVDDLSSKIDDKKLKKAFLGSAPVKSLLARTEE